FLFFFSSRRRHTRFSRDWSSDVCSSDLSAIRQVSAGILLLVALGISGKLKISKQDLLLQLVPGVLMIALGNGVIGWSERYIPSGLAALIVSVLPVYVVGINYMSGIDKKRPNYFIVSGL